MTVHFIDQPASSRAACNDPINGAGATTPGDVTCFGCRATPQFKQAQGGRTTDPLSNDERDAWRNERGMFVVEERIHHGDYRVERRIEVHEITPATVDGILMSSPYSYGPSVHADLFTEMIMSLRIGRDYAGIGWSTFRLITQHDPF